MFNIIPADPSYRIHLTQVILYFVCCIALFPPVPVMPILMFQFVVYLLLIHGHRYLYNQSKSWSIDANWLSAYQRCAHNLLMYCNNNCEGDDIVDLKNNNYVRSVRICNGWRTLYTCNEIISLGWLLNYPPSPCTYPKWEYGRSLYEINV